MPSSTKLTTRRTATTRTNLSRPPTTIHTIPTPFVAAPASVQPFVERLDPAQVYITHVDRTPRAVKQQVFAIPVILNGTIAALLLWRLWVALPAYAALILATLRRAATSTSEPAATWRAQIIILLRRTAMFMGDFVLARFVAVWPWTFFFERPQNPCSWRWALGGTHEAEMVVRQSRGWGGKELLQGVKQGKENAFFKTRILPAIEQEWMRKTGYLMMDRSWDLDFELMLDAQTLVEKYKTVTLQELDKVIWAHMEGVGWIMWQWEGPDGGDVIEERRRKVVAFKEKLTAMGKESLFWKWMEIVEDERDRDGGFTAEQQVSVAERVQATFREHGVDFEALSKSIGGLEEIKAPT